MVSARAREGSEMGNWRFRKNRRPKKIQRKRDRGRDREREQQTDGKRDRQTEGGEGRKRKTEEEPPKPNPGPAHFPEPPQLRLCPQCHQPQPGTSCLEQLLPHYFLLLFLGGLLTKLTSELGGAGLD